MLVKQSVQENQLRPCSGFVQVHSGLSGQVWPGLVQVLLRSSSMPYQASSQIGRAIQSVLHRDGTAAALTACGRWSCPLLYAVLSITADVSATLE